MVVFFSKQKTAYEIRGGDWSSDVCSSDLDRIGLSGKKEKQRIPNAPIHRLPKRRLRRRKTIKIKVFNVVQKHNGQYGKTAQSIDDFDACRRAFDLFVHGKY